MSWHKYIKDVDKLTSKLVTRYGLNRLAQLLSRDKQTINRWRSDQDKPSRASDVGHLIRLALKAGIDVDEFQIFNPVYPFYSLQDELVETETSTPPDFSWLLEVPQPPAARRDFFGLKLDSPLGVAASPLTSNEAWVRLLLALGYGLSTFRTRRTGKVQRYNSPNTFYVLEPPDLSEYDPDRPPQVVVSDRKSDSLGLISNIVNSYGIQSEPITQWQEIYRTIRQSKRGNLIGVSIIGNGASHSEIVNDFQKAVRLAKQLNPPFVELNLSFPDPEGEQPISFHTDLARTICVESRKQLENSQIRLFVKLPYLADKIMGGLLERIGESIDAVVFQNAIKIRAVRVEPRTSKEFSPFGGRTYAALSGPAIYRITYDGVTRLKSLRDKLGQNFKIIAAGGVTSFRDVDELLGIGADLVQVCTAAMFDPLLPWKIRYQYFHRLSANSQTVELVHHAHAPKDAWERAAFHNACDAVRVLHGQGVVIDSITFLNHWEEYILKQSRRRRSPRSSPDWIRVFINTD